MRFGPRIARGMAIACGVAAAVGCGSVYRPDPPTHAALLRGLDMPDAYAAGGRLYVAARVMPPVNWFRSELMRVDPISGRVYATRQLDSTFDQALLAHGVLWITTSWSTRTGLGRSWLWRLDPRTLAVRSRRAMSKLSRSGGFASMAIAGGWLWLASANQLDRISLSEGSVTRRIEVSQVAAVGASPSGQTLLVSEGRARSYVERRSPRTGALLARSRVFEGVTAPYIGGIVDGGAWISQSGGMMGYVLRLNLATLRISTGSPRPTGTNGIRAQLIGGVLWVSQLAGGPQRNYCGDLRSGVSRAPVKLPAWGQFLTADSTSVYYVPDANHRRQELDREAIDPRCDVAKTPAAAHSSTR